MSARLAPPSATPYLVAVVAGAMAFLAVCAFEAGQGAARLAGLWDAGLAGTATVRVPPGGDPEAAVRAALGALRVVPGVDAVRAVPAAEAEALLVPWLGPGHTSLGVALPRLIDLRLAEPPPAAAAVQAALTAAAPGAVYDDHGAWRAPLREAAAAFRRLTLGSVALMGVALVAMVVVAARASLAGAAATVRTLRLLGARDGLIAASFDRGIALRALAGAAVGTPLAALAVRALPLGGLGDSLGIALSPAPFPWALALGLPAGCGLLGWLTARVAILVMLREAP